MKNLAGVKDCDILIREELEKAGITIYRQKQSTDEVPFSLYGVLGARPLKEEDQSYMGRNGFSADFARKSMASIVFTRAWYYWRVYGFVPLSVAEEMYANPNGVKDIRVAGHCGCPPPSEWLVHYKVCGMDVVDSYHIDTQEGLNYFVQAMIKHGLV